MGPESVMMKIKTLMILLYLSLYPAVDAIADTVDIREWLVPWQASEPGHAFVDAGGRVWFVGQSGSYIGNFSPESAEFNRYDLRKGTVPTSIAVDSNRNVWFTSNKRRLIGSLNPSTGRVQEFSMPDNKAKDPMSIVLDQADNIWFTVENGNFLGRLQTATGQIDLIPIQTKKVRPHGIALDSNGDPWAAASGKNLLLHVNRADLSVTEIRTPNENSRFRRIAITSDNQVWYADFELGNIGRYNPQLGDFREWPLPGGPNSRPHGISVDKNDRLWIIETGSDPNRLIGFDTANETFLTQSDIPSGAGSINDMHYFEAAGEIWFGTLSNYIGRAKVH
jgi:virginiamycin B lyase